MGIARCTSEERIKVARLAAARRGLTGRMRFVVGDAFARHDLPMFDLVHWNNALHHMFDVAAAVRWSAEVLRPGGVFLLDDYVGPDRLAIADDELAFVDSLRSLLPDRLFMRGDKYPLPRRVTREWLESNIARDPSEAVDASQTMPALREAFPDAIVVPTGGLGYFIALNGIYANLDLDQPGDRALLLHVLQMDRLYTECRPDSTLYAVAFARKGAAQV